ncbi:PEP-CTERM sorting domain-containing protein [Oceanicoccus sagamiensis]|uniref:Ice-binding protein C-terminal domain-containing protein n=1 Tax=Oceanicoccus sagamiensis TaxID=716816 RepID=A0A1X9NNZ7_9GAMM|nr:PEP-CTERM sorting domain-containing protein [Oceanicoccus sagamiensis]ARN75613.1 hypothetical protein BST96_16775 [Oceanicoccus sagamiensis]
MLFTMKTALKAAAAACVLAASSQAISVPFLSTTDDVCTTTATVGPCQLVEINAHNAWQPAVGDAQWVSSVDSGAPGSVQVPNDAVNPFLTITETFTLSGSGNLTFDIWADDTARVSLNGDVKFLENTSQSTCADGIIGCEPGENGSFDWDLAAGTHTVTFEIFQIGSGPAGVMYNGNYTLDTVNVNNPVPEPGSLALLALGLAGLGMTRKKAA